MLGRYQSIRRTITGRLEQDESNSANVVGTVRRTQTDIDHHSNPGLDFLMRPDFQMVLRSNQVSLLRSSQSARRLAVNAETVLNDEFLFSLLSRSQPAFQFYSRTPTLKHMISRLRKNVSLYNQYKNNVDLINFLNYFADKTRLLPRGWASKVDGSGKVRALTTARCLRKVGPRLLHSPLSISLKSSTLVILPE